jgi:hypothetical protein
MRDLKLIDPAAPRLPDEWRREYLQRPIELLPKDVTVLFDRHEKLSREKDQINASLIEARSTLRIADLKIWILMLVVGGEGAVIGWLVKEFLAATR